MLTVLTYGTFDLFHVGHVNMLERLAEMGDRLVVGVSTDVFNRQKGKRAIFSFDERARIVASLRCVHAVFPETCWEQKIPDIKRLRVTTFGMGKDWSGKFDALAAFCKVVYLDRTENISTTSVRHYVRALSEGDAPAKPYVGLKYRGLVDIRPAGRPALSRAWCDRVDSPEG